LPEYALAGGRFPAHSGAVAEFQAAKAEFRHRRRKIVATRPLRIDEAPVVEKHLVKGGRPEARNEAVQKQINLLASVLRLTA
jgi:hypothetical protein